VTLQDDLVSQPGSLAVLSGYNLRQCYSTAIIRLVNGLVDPLQSGVYARSIASIAAQLGLPAWLVEVRHAATHEELPSLEILREAAHEVIFFPTLASYNLLINAMKFGSP
jgi:ribosomal biogenesis protein LAS1